MKNNKMLLNIFVFSYFLFAFLSLHTINNIYFYLFSLMLGVLFLFKRFLKLSCSILLSALVLMPIWLLFNNIFYERFLHYTLISDVLTAFLLPVIFNLINCDKKFKINVLFLILPLVNITFSQYYATENLIYWTSILIAIICGANIFEKKYEKESSRNAFIILFIVYLLVSFYYLFDFYRPVKSDKIAILKSDWCNAANIPNKENHQIAYFYAYSDFMKILNSYGDTTIIDNQDLEDGTPNYDIIILITPTTPINSIQAQKLHNFVKRGGRLVLITDHTNLYGHLDSVHSLLKSFNIRMNDDAVFNPTNYYEKAILNTNSLKLNKVMMKTGNSIIPSVLSKVWAITPKIISEKADYTKDNFFGELVYTSDDTVGNFPIGTTIKKGLGTFVIWNDSTIFSNFGMSQEDNIKLLDYIVKNKIYNNKERKINYKFIKIFANDNKTFWEAPPNHAPDSIHYSTLVANFTRNNLFPEFIEKPTKDTIYFTTYDYLRKNINKINSSKIVIIDDIPEDNFLNIKKFAFDDNKMTSSLDDFYYSQNGKYITILYEGKNIVLAKNVFSDNELGTWWNTTPVSPYKKEMISSFLNWVENGDKILIYQYPNLTCKKQGYLVNFSNNSQEYWDKICVSEIIKFDKNNIVYIGNRKWAFVIDKNTYFGNPEMSDNYLNTLSVKWTAKSMNKKSKIKPRKNTGCPINKFRIGTKNVAP